MPFSSTHPPISVPPDESIWSFFFTSAYSPLSSALPDHPNGFLDASTGRSLSIPTVKEYATNISTALSKHFNLQPGDTVALFSQNTIWYPVAMFAVLRIGGIVSGASPAYGVDEMAYALRVGKAKFLMTHPERLEVALEAAKQAGVSKDRILLLEGQAEGFLNVEDLIERGKKEKQVEAWDGVKGKGNGNVCAFLSFSSGTTGLPKAVMISHQNVIAQCLQVKQLSPPDLNRVLAVLPLFHITGLVHILHLPILLNAQVVMLPSFTMASMLDAVTKYQIPELLLVPPLIIRLVRDPVVEKYDLSHVKRFSSGAAPLSEEILALLKQKFPHTGFKQGYGMTESCSCITAHPPHLYDYKYAHTVGTIVPSTVIKILKEDNTEAGINEPGEILAKGPQITMGYLDNEKATRETFDADGFMHTGDQGSIDENGVVTILDRIKEMIKVKGIGVAPAELEDLLLGHPKIEDVAVLSIPDDYAGERPKAYIVLKTGQNQDKQIGEELLKYVKEKKVRHKWIREIEFTDAIPKSASGKILRRVLRDKARGTDKGVVVRDAVKEKAML